MGTDTRGLWFNKDVLAKAGLPEDWAPKSWDELLEAARAIKESDPDVVPFNVYSGKPQGEAAVMQGFEMLLYGTGDTLYEDGKWVLGSQGFVDSLDFVETVFTEGLAPDAAAGARHQHRQHGPGRVAARGQGRHRARRLVGGRQLARVRRRAVARVVRDDGHSARCRPRTAPGAGRREHVGRLDPRRWAPVRRTPTPRSTFISLALNRENSLWFDVANSQIAVRTDVAEDPEYTETNPTTEFFTDLVDVTNFRPATSDYPKVSNEIMVAMESVMTGQQTPEEAAAVYDEAVTGIVGEENTTQG